MKRQYFAPEAEPISFSPAEAIAVELGDISNPFDLAVAEDEAIEQAEREAALAGNK